MPDPMPLATLHQQAGATLGRWLGIDVPWRFSDTQEEYRAVREAAGLSDLSVWGLVEVRGKDRASFLHNLLTNDIETMPSGSGCEACLLDPSAKVLAKLLVLADDASHWLLMDRGCVLTVLKTLDHYLITEAVSFHDQTAGTVCLALQGPRTPPVLKEAFGPTQPGRSLDHAVAETEGIAARLIACSLTGEPGAILEIRAEHAARLWRLLLERGRAHGAAPVGWDALNTLRIEAGIPWYGIDVDDTNLLPETGLEARTASATKGCYVGQEVIARLHTYGSVSRKLMGLVVEASDAPSPKDPIVSVEGETLGAVTSACFSPALKRAVGLGYVKRPFYRAGASVRVARGGRAVPATLASLPFLSGRTP